jgi:hypothetical protein
MIFTYTIDFSWEKNDSNLPDFKEKKIQIARFYAKFQ